ncbi:DUF547 domain-containing protein [Trichostrongylus colubriformis]|uniref:DUF547 domain-containing protein n=1 Tax=Trichostrongylus colubriformis TaxID=6319 RepID=A0AAN8ID52_TRICO
MLPTVYENEEGSQDADQQFWINQYYNSSNESDDEFCSEFDFSGMGYQAFRLSDNAESYNYGQETIDEHSELVISMSNHREDNSHSAILNSGQTDEQIYSAAAYNEKLVQIMKPIFSDIIVDNYKSILYYKLSGNDAFQAYISHSRNLQNLQLQEASPDERLALFINIYNMMTIHATYLHGPPRSVWDRRKGVRKELRDSALEALESDSAVRVDVSRRVLHFSKLFQWYAADFGYTMDKCAQNRNQRADPTPLHTQTLQPRI